MNKYEQLTQDIIEANKVAKQASDKVDDGGTANLDSVFLVLKNWREKEVVKAIKAAGIYCRGKIHWIGDGYLISINEGQGNKRTVARDAFLKYMKDKNYNVLGFDKID